MALFFLLIKSLLVIKKSLAFLHHGTSWLEKNYSSLTISSTISYVLFLLYSELLDLFYQNIWRITTWISCQQFPIQAHDRRLLSLFNKPTMIKSKAAAVSYFSIWIIQQFSFSSKSLKRYSYQITDLKQVFELINKHF